jgi:multidrug efflux pump subunit AcrA (membrane-fusion protein)
MRIRLGTRLSRAAGSAIAATTAGAAIAAIALTGCASHAAPAQHGPPPASVATAKVTRGNIATYAVFDGQITPVFQTTLSTAEAGTIASVNVTEGDFVQRGQLLASLDTSQLQASLKANEAMVRARRSAAHAQQRRRAGQLATVHLGRVHRATEPASRGERVRARAPPWSATTSPRRPIAELLKQEYVSRQTYEQARAAYVAARDAAQRLQAGRHRRTGGAAHRASTPTSAKKIKPRSRKTGRPRRSARERRTVASADRAVVDRRAVRRPGHATAARSRRLRRREFGHLDDLASFARLRRGQRARRRSPLRARQADVTFTTTSLPGRTFHGNVFDVNTTPTSGTLSYRVRLLQPNPDLTLRGGMLVSVTTVRERHVNALIVPSQAVFTTPKGRVVYTVVAGKGARVPVRVGLQTDTPQRSHGQRPRARRYRRDHLATDGTARRLAGHRAR